MRNDVGQNVSRDTTTLCLDDGQSRQGSSTEHVDHLRGTLKQAREKVEDVAGVSGTGYFTVVSYYGEIADSGRWGGRRR